MTRTRKILARSRTDVSTSTRSARGRCTASRNCVKTSFDYLRSRYVNDRFLETVFTRKIIIRETRSRQRLSERGALSCSVPVRCAPFYLVFSFGRSPCIVRDANPLGSKIETRVRLFVNKVRSSISERRVRSDSRAGENERKVKRKKEKGKEKRRSTLLRSFVLEKRARSLAGSLGRTIALRAAYDETTTNAFQGKTRMSESFVERTAARRHPRLVHEVQSVRKRRDETAAPTMEDDGRRRRARSTMRGVLTRSAKRPALGK